MAQKEVLIKIKVDGKEVKASTDELKDFNKGIVKTREDLESIEKVNEEVAESFDKVGDSVEDLGDSFDKTKTDIDDFEESTSEAAVELRDLGAEIGEVEQELAALGPRTRENAQRYDELAARGADLRRQQEDVALATQTMGQSLSAIPGPIGAVAGSFEGLRVAGKNVRAGFTGLAKTFPILDKAIAATGIGALVIILGLLVGAVIKAFNSFKPLQDAVGRFGTLFDTLGDIIQPIIDLIGKGLVVALDGLAKALAWVTGKSKEFNEAIAEKQALQDAEDNLNKLQLLYKISGDKYDEFLKRRIEAKQAAADRAKEIDESEVLTDKQKKRALVLNEERLQRDLAKIEEDKKKAADEAKAAEIAETEKRLQAKLDIEKDYASKLAAAQNEAILLSLENEQERAIKALDIQLEAQNKEIDQLKVTEEKKQALREEQAKIYALKLAEINKTAAEKEAELEAERIQKNKEANQKIVDDAKLASDKKLELLELQNMVELEGSRQHTANLLAIEQEQYEQEVLMAADNAAKLEAIEAIHAKNITDIKQAQLVAENDIFQAKADVLAQFGGLLQQVAGENKALAIAGIVVEKAASIGQIIANTGVANAAAVAASPLTAGMPWVAINTATAGLSIGASIAGAAKAIGEINSAGSGEESGGAAASAGQNLGKNYASGGLLSGPSHSQGGIPLVAEGGEAIMTKGAVSAFAPVLSAMNVMGGGASFSSAVGQPPMDKPMDTEKASQPIIKTYVVSSDMTSEQEKQGKLKQLSTL